MLNLSSSFIIFFYQFISYSNSKFSVTVTVYKYENLNDLKHDGSNCDIRGKCDPIFDICITQNEKCDMFLKTTQAWTDSSRIDLIFKKSILLESLQKSISLLIKIDDADENKNELIGIFSSTILIKKLNFIYKARMINQHPLSRASLQFGIYAKCEENYYGKECKNACISDNVTYKCNNLNGSKIPLFDCGNGTRLFDNKKNSFYCICSPGLTGNQCNILKTNNCPFNDILKCKELQDKTNTIQYQKITSTESTGLVTILSSKWAFPLVIFVIVIVFCIGAIVLYFGLRRRPIENPQRPPPPNAHQQLEPEIAVLYKAEPERKYDGRLDSQHLNYYEKEKSYVATPLHNNDDNDSIYQYDIDEVCVLPMLVN